MKTAKEVCKKLQEDKVNYIISTIESYGGEINTIDRDLCSSYNRETGEKTYYEFGDKISQDTLQKLKELGFKVEETCKTLPTSYESKCVTVLKPAIKILGFTIIKERECKVNIDRFPVMTTFTGYKISACCSNDNT